MYVHVKAHVCRVGFQWLDVDLDTGLADGKARHMLANLGDGKSEEWSLITSCTIADSMGKTVKKIPAALFSRHAG